MLNLGLKLKMAKGPGGVSGLSDDTSLSAYTIDSEDVLSLSNIQRGNGVTEVPVSATPTHPGATRTINGSSDPDPVTMALSTGDNACTVTVTAEDGVTTEDHIVTVRRLTAGVQEITRIPFGATSGSSFVTGGVGIGLILTNETASVGFWANAGNSESQPDWSADGATAYKEVAIDSGMDSAGVAAAFQAEFSTSGFSVANPTSDTVDATCLTPGARPDAVDKTGFLSLTIIQPGENPS